MGAGTMKTPDISFRPTRTLGGALAPGSKTNATLYAAVVNVSNAVNVIIRISSAVSGSMVVAAVRPTVGFDVPEQAVGGPITQETYTKYTTNAFTGSPVAVTGATEAFLAIGAGGAGNLNGESYIVVEWTPSSTGNLNWIDVSMTQRAIG